MSGRSFCAVPLPHLVYAGPRTIEEFESLKLPEGTPSEWKPDETHTLLAGDGLQYEFRVRHKTIGEIGNREGMAVIFQWFERRVVTPDKAEAEVAA